MKKILISLCFLVGIFSLFLLEFNLNSYSYVAARGDKYNSFITYQASDILDCVILLNDDSIINIVEENDGVLSDNEVKLIQDKTAMQTKYLQYLTSNYEIDCSNSFSFTYLFNGFSAKIKYSDLDAIYQLDFIKDVLISNVYESLDTSYTSTQLLEDEIIYSDNSMNSLVMKDAGYTGKGTAVAVLDTGMDVTHIAFSGDIEQQKFSKTDIDQIIKNGSLNAIGVNNANQVYYSDKIPFQFDYADADANVYCSNLMHGAHVAGIIGANAGATRGIATDCQIIPMKVFSDEGYSTTSGILAAVEDACKIGVDVINMSLGAASGNTYTDQQTQAIYENVRNYGINLIVASGNDAYMGYNNQYDTNLPLTTTPDYGITGSPASYLWSTAVASFNNPYYFSECIYSIDFAIPYLSSSNGDDIRTTLDGKTLEFVEIPNYGADNDYSGIDVSGKIALVKRGEISFTEKHQAAYNAGAVAMIAYDPNEDVLVGMQIEDQKIPCAFITKSYFEMIKTKGYTTFTFKKDGYEAIEDLISGNKLSYFSSFGCAGDLVIKPDISGPGGNIYAPLIDNQYAQMSGTSMACPNIAGLVAITRQYLNEKMNSLSRIEQVDTAISLIMSTATIQYDENNHPYLVRAQGAGLGNAQGILNANAYLSVPGQDKPKAQLGSSLSGEYTFSFTINNFSNTELTYHLSDLCLTEDYQTIDGRNYSTTLSRVLSNYDYTISYSENVISNEIKVAANSNEIVMATIKLSESYKNAQDAIFTEGSYVEGYIILTNGSEVLSLPYLGFYGDWDQLHLFEGSVYEDDPLVNMQPSLAVAFDASGSGYELGYNLASGNFYQDKIYFTTSTLKNFSITSYSGLCRNVEEMKFQIFDAKNNLVYESIGTDYKKSLYSLSNDYTVAAYDPNFGWDGTKKDGTKAANGEKYKYITTAYRKDNEGNILYQESWSFDFIIDNLAPSLVSNRIYQENNHIYLEIKAKDNMNIAYISLFDYDLDYSLANTYINDNDDKTVTAIFDITNIYDEIDAINGRFGEIKVGIFDWAYNFTYETVTIGPSIISLDKEYKVGVGGSKALQLQISPSNISLDDLIITSSNEKVAVVENGVIKGIAKGEAIITIRGLNGYIATTKVIVDGVADISIQINKEDFAMYVDDVACLKVVFTPNYVTDKSVTWLSSDDNVAVVTQNGVVTALQEGTVTITATSANGNTDTIVITILPPIVKSIKIYLFSKTIKVGSIVQFDYFVVTPSSVDLTTLNYSSSDENVAVIDNNGNITAVGAGTVEIKVASPDDTIYDAVTIRVINVNATSINIDSNYALYLDDQISLKPEILPIDTTNKKCIFSSNNDKIAKVDDDGTVTALNVGNAVITIKCGEITKDVSINVLPVDATAITVTQSLIVMNMHEQYNVNVDIYPLNTTYKNLIWSSSDDSVCTVYNGVIKAIKAGYATINIELANGVKTSIYVIVNQVSDLALITDLYLNQSDYYNLNSCYQYTLISNSDIIFLDGNQIVAVKEGICQLLVSNEIGETKTITVTISEITNHSKQFNDSIVVILGIFASISFIGLVYFQIKYLKTN